MIKTLYVRVVLTFLGAVLFGMASAFFLTTFFYTNLVREEIQDKMMDNGKDIVHTLTLLKEEKIHEYLTTVSRLSEYYITLYEENKSKNVYGETEPREKVDIADPVVVQVQSGEVYRSLSGFPDQIVVGFPFQIDTVHYAIFFQYSRHNKESALQKAVITTLFITLLMGSLFIFVAARYVVKPLRVMTEATKRMSKGDFNMDWKLKRRKDELGMLAQSFSEMALELKQLEQMRQDFVSNVSHEIQTPLTSISGFSKALRSNRMSEEERLYYLEIIQSESERLSRMSENLLKLASLESMHHPYQPHTYDLDEQIRHVIVACEPQWSAKQIEFELNMPSIKICADEDLLNQVWMNLITNSIKFSPQSGWIHIQVKQTTNEITVSISDQGIGISEEDQGRIFERFYKADKSRTGEHSGSGLGLAIVNKIVLLHLGRISIQSATGKGSTFSVTLPSIPVTTIRH
ncbi:Signal transduction histidine kinase [Paenibacillus sp. 1_12]|uniref:HAMP domain-containing sensor histidine kinase n=1 Tax=Paenibacillus sp. 1_12 TaxID=1566278 RepID=UPI0008E3405D|nr:HAMP domain-containing sensor histidine kinase [Paenibacillus sp. 1_12]SFM07216.1 Signal transduction histidine kinase [Paenibacillus sp. 1_12]